MRRAEEILARFRVITSGQNHTILARGFGRAFADKLAGDAAVLVAVGEASMKIRKIERRYAALSKAGKADEVAFEILSGQRRRAMVELDVALGSLFGEVDDAGEDVEGLGVHSEPAEVSKQTGAGASGDPGGALL